MVCCWVSMCVGVVDEEFLSRWGYGRILCDYDYERLMFLRLLVFGYIHVLSRLDSVSGGCRGYFL